MEKCQSSIQEQVPFVKALTKEDGPNGLGMLQKCRFLCFSREEEFTLLPSENKVDEKTPG